MAINKIVLNTDAGQQTLVDLTDSTVTADKLAEGVTAYDKAGEKITGTMKSGEDLEAVLTEQEELIVQLASALGSEDNGDTGSDTAYKKELEYIESTGTQHIDTGYIPNTNTTCEVMMSGISETSFNSASGTWFLGARKGYLNNAFGMYYNPIEQNLYYASGNVMPTAKYYSLYGNVKVFKLDSTGLYIDGVRIIQVNSNAFNSSVPLVLFGLNNNGSVISKTGFKIHYCKILDSGSLIHDFIPVLDWDDVPCMYDKVSGELFYGDGTDEFLYRVKSSDDTNEGRIRANNDDLRECIEAVENLPDGVELPELENEGSAADLLSGKQLIDGEGNVVTGTLVPKADPVLQSKTVTPTKSAQNVAPDNGYDALSGVTVNAIPAEYIVPDGTKNISANGTHDVTAYKSVAVNVPIPDGYVKPSDTKAATTYTPTTSNQTIAAGTYCSGAQTIKGDANLVADNIKSGVSIFGVAGSYEGSGGGSGGGVDTCTVIIRCVESDFGETPNIQEIFATTFDGVEYSYVCIDGLSNGSVTIENVVCGSIMGYFPLAIRVRTTCSNVKQLITSAIRMYQATAGNGETATITITALD